MFLKAHLNDVVGFLLERRWSLGFASRGTEMANLPLQLNTDVG